MKETTTWRSERLHREMTLVRWGAVGTPLLLFPTAGGDSEECERFLMIDALAPLLEAQRLKVYSVDSVASRAWVDGEHDSVHAARIQNAFDGFIAQEVVPAIRTDCQDDSLEVMVGGASLGAFNALACLTRHPDLFSTALCLSGSYDMSKFCEGPVSADHYFSSPLHFLPDLEGDALSRLRDRFVLLAHGEGKYEDPEQSWRVADLLGKRAIPNRVDSWGAEHDHDWPTWREMLPKYLDEFLPS